MTSSPPSISPSGNSTSSTSTPSPPTPRWSCSWGRDYDLTDREVKLLADYWDKGGRLLVLLNPEFPTPRLANFLTGLGVRPDDDRILGVVNALGVRRLISSALTLFAGDTPIALRLSELTPLFMGSTQSLSITPEAGAASGLKVGPLLIAAKGFWGEVDYKDMGTTGAENDPTRDKQAPLYVAATVEKGAVGDQRVQVTSSRMIVFGNARFVDPESMDQQMYDVFINCVNWLGEREALIGIPPKAGQVNAPEHPRPTGGRVALDSDLRDPRRLCVPGFCGVVVASPVLNRSLPSPRASPSVFLLPAMSSKPTLYLLAVAAVVLVAFCLLLTRTISARHPDNPAPTPGG